jgi:hypothetical protein
MEAQNRGVVEARKPLPLELCQRFDKCSVNNCPLHPSYPDLIVDLEDPKTKCKLGKY